MRELSIMRNYRSPAFISQSVTGIKSFAGRGNTQRQYHILCLGSRLQMKEQKIRERELKLFNKQPLFSHSPHSPTPPSIISWDHQSRHELILISATEHQNTTLLMLAAALADKWTLKIGFAQTYSFLVPIWLARPGKIVAANEHWWKPLVAICSAAQAGLHT